VQQPAWIAAQSSAPLLFLGRAIHTTRRRARLTNAGEEMTSCAQIGHADTEVAVEDCSIRQCRHRRPQDPTLLLEKKRQHRQPPRKQGAAQQSDLVAEHDAAAPLSTSIEPRECGNRPQSPRNRSDGAILRLRLDFFRRGLELPPLYHSSGTRNGTRNRSFFRQTRRALQLQARRTEQPPGDEEEAEDACASMGDGIERSKWGGH
jgi:hypothetical protein